ncbi:hypothetical protein F5B17DRAFT_149871 [Nemania serpens]|nr:hypothetical protein F5B17DRAFT_149871 [Nemania serpens]
MRTLEFLTFYSFFFLFILHLVCWPNLVALLHCAAGTFYDACLQDTTSVLPYCVATMPQMQAQPSCHHRVT